MFLGKTSSIEPHETDEISYNPDWVCIIVKGSNIHVYRWIGHDCVRIRMDHGRRVTREVGPGAISRPERLHREHGTSPFVSLVWGAPARACRCRLLDFGDAPTPTLPLEPEGARHTSKSASTWVLASARSQTASRMPRPRVTTAMTCCADLGDGCRSVATVQITASVNGVINAWIDWNRMPTGRHGREGPGGMNLSGQRNTISFSVRATALGATPLHVSVSARSRRELQRVGQ